MLYFFANRKETKSLKKYINLLNKFVEGGKLEFGYVIIGAGSAGCVIANRLSANPSVSVALIEAGSEDRYPWIHIPVGYFKSMGNPKTDWCCRRIS